jgi:phospholipase C
MFDAPRSAQELQRLTQIAYSNCPYDDSLLKKARPAPRDSIVPSVVGEGSPIKHAIYIIKENRTYDQVLGDMPKGNGDARLAIFGADVTPNHHAIADEFVFFDNCYCDAEVSRDGHMWSNAAYATDFVEKTWPTSYSRRGESPDTEASMPAAGFIWDLCKAKGLTFRSYGEMRSTTSLAGHSCPNYLGWQMRDTDNAKIFLAEFDEYDAAYDSPNPQDRLPNFIVMSLPENHTKGAQPGVPTPRAAVASNDLALGMILERVSHSRYWKEMALFTAEDDAQDGPDHVDAHRTVALCASPYIRRGTADSTLYTTSTMLRTIELLLGLPPMSQYDAAAAPMYNAFTKTPDLTPYTCRPARIDINEMNKPTAWGAQKSLEMDFSEFDRTPMFELNEIVRKSVKRSRLRDARPGKQVVACKQVVQTAGAKPINK